MVPKRGHPSFFQHPRTLLRKHPESSGNRKSRENFQSCLPQNGMDYFRCHFRQRLHDKPPHMHQRMGQRQVRHTSLCLRKRIIRLHDPPSIQQQVNVNRTVGILSRHALAAASQLTLHSLRNAEQLLRRLVRAPNTHGIQKRMFGPESPRGRLIKGGEAFQSAYPPCQQIHSLPQHLLPMAQVAAQAQI